MLFVEVASTGSVSTDPAGHVNKIHISIITFSNFFPFDQKFCIISNVHSCRNDIQKVKGTFV